MEQVRSGEINDLGTPIIHHGLRHMEVEACHLREIGLPGHRQLLPIGRRVKQGRTVMHQDLARGRLRERAY